MNVNFLPFVTGGLIAISIVGVQMKPATAESLAGKGQLTLTNSQWSGWQKYKNLFQPEAFAVNPRNGGWSYRFCPDNGACATEDRSQVIYDCYKKSGAGCKLFAMNKQIVWQGTVCYAGEVIQGSGDCTENFKKHTYIPDIPKNTGTTKYINDEWWIPC